LPQHAFLVSGCSAGRPGRGGAESRQPFRRAAPLQDTADAAKPMAVAT
jgi:hypothetical protein